jgi:hypothetical protein
MISTNLRVTQHSTTQHVNTCPTAQHEVVSKQRGDERSNPTLKAPTQGHQSTARKTAQGGRKQHRKGGLAEANLHQQHQPDGTTAQHKIVSKHCREKGWEGETTVNGTT